MKIACVHDWLVVMAGAERCLSEILSVYPEADLFSTVDFFSPEDRRQIGGKQATTTFIQRLPKAKRLYRSYLPLMPLAVEQLDLTNYDVILSGSHAVAKGVLTSSEQLHICYCYCPMRYAWDLQHQYLRESNLLHGLKSWTARYLLHRLRRWDLQSAMRVDAFIAISKTVARRVWKTYRRRAQVIYPPVNVDTLPFSDTKDDYYLTVSRMVPYKRIDMIVEAFNALPNKRLLIVGDGPDRQKIQRAIRSPRIELLGHLPDPAVHALMQRARGFIFAAEEDFGIVPVEAMACGTPVIGYGRGGLTETVIPNQTGIFFPEQTPASLMAALQTFEKTPIDPHACRTRANLFNAPRFRQELTHCIAEHQRAFALR